MSTEKSGKLIVIEGGDGSGKTTQTTLLLKYLSNNNIPHVHLDFPQYDSFYGDLVAKFLRGELGKLEQVSPYLAALPFALDRSKFALEIQNHLNQGKLVISNRYVTSNMAHQGSKFTDKDARLEFVKWIEELEYVQNQMPKEDIVLYLKLPPEVTNDLTSKKNTRAYLKGVQDIQEEDFGHRTTTTDMYDFLSATNEKWIPIDCFKHGTLLKETDIHKKIIERLNEKNLV